MCVLDILYICAAHKSISTIFTESSIHLCETVTYACLQVTFLSCLSCVIFLCVFLLIKEATRLALVSGDQATYARSIRIMGDIYRKKSEINVSIVVSVGGRGKGTTTYPSTAVCLSQDSVSCQIDWTRRTYPMIPEFARSDTFRF